MRKEYSLESYDSSRMLFTLEKLRGYFASWSMEGFFGYEFNRRRPELELLAELNKNVSAASHLSLTFNKAGAEFNVSFFEDGDLLVVNTSAEPEGRVSDSDVHEVILAQLRLRAPSKAELESSPTLYLMNQRLVRILKRIEGWDEAQVGGSNHFGKNCFVSFSFNEHGKSLAFELRDFLDLLGVGFLSGFGYEPRSFSEKVLERLNEPISLFIVLFTRAENQEWLHQEIGIARGRGLPVMVLVEDGVEVRSGVVADNEYFQFPKDTICKTFIPVLQALRYVATRKPA